MAGKKRFRTALFGFKRADVTAYIDKMIKDFEDRVKAREEELVVLRNQLKDARNRYEELHRKVEGYNEDNEKIRTAIIRAEEMSEQIKDEARQEAEQIRQAASMEQERILQEARSQAIDERRRAGEDKRKIELLTEQERERLVDLKEEVREMQAYISDILGRMNQELDHHGKGKAG